MQGIYWLASYPRSGNTWMRLLLDSYDRGGGTIDINQISSGDVYGRRFADAVLCLSTADLTVTEVLAQRPDVIRALAARAGQPAIVKTHDMRARLPDGQWLVPADASLGGLYLVRDPRDVVLSLATLLGCSVDQAITIMGTPGHMRATSRDRQNDRLVNLWGSWRENVESWLSPTPFPIHVIRYEDLRHAPEPVLTDAIRALGRGVDTDRIAAAVLSTSLETLHRQEQQTGFVEQRGRGRFFGAGTVGGWQRHLSTEQAARIVDMHGDVMARLGYLA